MIIDVHTHIFPDHIAADAVKFLAEEAKVPAYTDGKKSSLLESMQTAGVDQSWLQPVATKAKQVSSINAMMKEIHKSYPGKLISFGAIHPDCEDLPGIIHDLAESNIPGIKIHPEYHQINPLDERFFPMYEALIEENMAILYHAGVDIGIPTVNSTPKDFAVLHEKYPKLQLILAHMGGYKQWDDVSRDLVGMDVVFDTAYLVGLNDDDFIQLARKHGIDKIVFGTDSPWSDQTDAIKYIQELPFTVEEKEAIFYKNAQRLLSGLL